MDNEDKEEQEFVDFDKPSFKFEPNENHDWRQQGPYLVCKSCELTHAVFVGNEKILVGIDEKGKPILKSRKSVFGG